MAIETTTSVDVQTLTPFKKFIMTIGNLPTSYLESMTYAEMLMWFCNYLQETVIPTVNNNAEAVEELQGLYEELQEYVNNYFDNLDVQDEINQKLDTMAQDGSLTNLIKDYVDPIYSAYEDEINSEIANIHAEVISAVSGMPIPVSSTSAMEDTTKLYLNTTDGYWYYYNGSAWTQGGIYQATSIGDGQIDLLNLDNLIQANFNTSYSDPISLGDDNVGFAKISSNNLVIDTNSNYRYNIVNLTPNVIYQVNASDYGSNLQGYVIVDSDNNVLLYSNHGHDTTNNWYGASTLFRVRKSGCKIYISKANSGTAIYLALYPMLRTLNNISNNLKIDTSVKLVDSYTDNFCNSVSGYLRITSTSGFNVYIYSYEKGKKYKITSYNIYASRGITVTDETGNIIYVSSTSSVNPATYCEYTFTATTNGYIVISQQGTRPYSVEVLYDAITLNVANKFKNLKIGADGDSISAGASGNLSYLTQIANANSCTLQNLSVGGGTIASNTYSGETARHWICTSVQNLDNDCDLIMLSGGVNDYWNKVPMGTITEDYTTTLDPTTFIGGLETMCRTVLDKFKTQKIVFVTYHKINNIYNTYNGTSGERHTFKEYLDAIKLVMDKYSIPIIDINSKGRFNTALDDYKVYTNDSDGVHPTTQGYNLFYNDIVINELNNLL